MKEETNKSSAKKIAGKIRPDCSAVGPNLGDYSPRVHQRAPAKKKNKKETLKSSRKTIAGKIRPDYSAVGPNLGDYSPRVRQRAPAKKKKDLLRLSDKSAVRLPSSSTLRLKVVTRRFW